VTLAYVGIGSNLGDPRAQVLAAFQELDRLPHTRVVKRSSLWRSAPVGYADQPDFINAVAEIETSLSPDEILVQLKSMEARHGRERSFANAPRTLDLDLLLFGNTTLDTPTLRIPHPRMHERAFVLKPLLEMAPEVVIPGIGPAKTSIEKISFQKAERIA